MSPLCVPNVYPQVEGLSLEAVEASDLQQVLNDEVSVCACWRDEPIPVHRSAVTGCQPLGNRSLRCLHGLPDFCLLAFG